MTVEEDTSVLEFYINGCALLAISIFGIIGNTISILLLRRKKSRLNPTFSNLIIWLAVLDSIFLVTMIYIFSLPSLSPHYKTKVFPVVLPLLFPISNVALTGSLYTILATSVERFLQLIKPQHGNQGSFFGYILPVAVFSLIYNAPKFMEFRTSFTTDTSGQQTPHVVVTEFRSNINYSYYVLGANFIFMGALPFSLLTVCTVKISRIFRALVSTEETTMVTLLYALVTVQLICYTPRTALNVYEFYLALTYHEMFLSHKWLVDLSHLMLAVATASNVAILAAQDLSFRAALLSDIKRIISSYRIVGFVDSSPSSPQQEEEGEVGSLDTVSTPGEESFLRLKKKEETC